MRYLLRFTLLIACVWLVACTSPGVLHDVGQRVLHVGTQVAAAADYIPAFFFDRPPAGTPDPGDAPVVRPPRRVPFIDPAVEEMKRVIALAEARAKEPPPANWVEMFKRLPKDDENNIDWMAALKDKIINPASSHDPEDKKPPPKVMDMDVDISTSGKPDRLVVFPHAVHTQWLVCDNCHPAIFEQEAGSAKITMAAINEGKFCGVCHDAVAVAQPSGCLGCHKVKTPAKKP